MEPREAPVDTQPVAFHLRGLDDISGLVPSTVIDETPPTHRPLTVIDDLAIGWGDFVTAHVKESMAAVLARAPGGSASKR